MSYWLHFNQYQYWISQCFTALIFFLHPAERGPIKAVFPTGSAGWAHLRSVPHHGGPRVSQLVSARPFVVVSQEDVALQVSVCASAALVSEHRSHVGVQADSHPGSADSTSRTCACSSCTASVHSLGSSRCRRHTWGTAWWKRRSPCWSNTRERGVGCVCSVKVSAVSAQWLIQMD